MRDAGKTEIKRTGTVGRTDWDICRVATSPGNVEQAVARIEQYRAASAAHEKNDV